VLEHLLSLKEIFELFARILKPGGVVFIMVPNSGGKKARDLGIRWQAMINEKHTLALEGGFFEKNMTPFGFNVRAFSDLCTSRIYAALSIGTSRSPLRVRN
jgi:2-polyprenyl-3-methyl-5-hydroxy-6-metoxy-1,4-benzoquinol methylase